MKDVFFKNDEPFIDRYMVNLATQMKIQTENEVVKAIHSVAVGVDKEKVKQWLERDAMLDKIEESTLIDIAVSKRIRQLQRTIKERENEIESQQQRIEELENALIDANEQIEMLENGE